MFRVIAGIVFMILASAGLGANDAPTVATSATAAVNASGTSAAVTVLGADDGGEANLIYAWTASGPAAVTFSASGTNAAKSSTATFSGAGAYTVTATITDAGGLSVTSAVAVTISSLATTVAIIPSSVDLSLSGGQVFSATACDQFGSAMSPQPTITWTADAGIGTITSGGVFTVHGKNDSTGYVYAAVGAVTAKSLVSLADTAPVVTAVQAEENSTEVILSTSVSSDVSLKGDIYTWTATGPAGVPDVTFSSNSSSVAASTIATVGALGTYVFAVTVEDAYGKSGSGTTAFTVTPDTVVTVSPGSVNLPQNGAQQFAISGMADQFGSPLAPPYPSATWSVAATVGTISSTGALAVSGKVGASGNVLASTGDSLGGTSLVTIYNETPVLTSATAAVQSDDIHASLSATGTDDGGWKNLTWTWTATGPAITTFATNATISSFNDTATFAQAGDYVIALQMSDQEGAFTSATMAVTVPQIMKTVAIVPAAPTIDVSATQAFTVSVSDQFGLPVASYPSPTWTSTAGTWPGGGNVFVPPTSPGSATVTAHVGSLTASTVVTFTHLPPVITSVATATGQVATAFSYQIVGTDVPTSYGASGLPAGLSVNATTGLITGTPTAAGSASATITATNAGGTGSQNLVITVLPVAPMITSAGTASGTVSSVFTYQITAINGPTSYGATGLPSGLSVDPATGLISGTPTSAGTATASITATNAGGTGLQNLVITVLPVAPMITSAGTVSGTVSSVFTYQITATNGPTSFGATGLPSGLSVDPSSGLINGIPTSAGTATAVIAATNANGTGSQNLVITIVPAAPVITSMLVTTGTIGSPFSYHINAPTATSYDASGLPSGLSIDTASGAISGTPTSAGTATASITATNAGGTDTRNLVITIHNVLAFTVPATAVLNANQSQAAVTASAAEVGISTLDYQWSASGPAPVYFSPAGISTTADATASFTATGSYTLTVSVSDGSGSVSSSTTVAVASVASSLSIAPTNSATIPIIAVTPGNTLDFTAQAFDQFDNAITVTWSSDGGQGCINPSTGAYFTGDSINGNGSENSATLTATAGGLSASSVVIVTDNMLAEWTGSQSVTVEAPGAGQYIYLSLPAELMPGMDEPYYSYGYNDYYSDTFLIAADGDAVQGTDYDFVWGPYLYLDVPQNGDPDPYADGYVDSIFPVEIFGSGDDESDRILTLTIMPSDDEFGPFPAYPSTLTITIKHRPATPTITLASGTYAAPISTTAQVTDGSQLWYALGSGDTSPTPIPGATGTYPVTGPILLPIGTDTLAVIAESTIGSATAVSLTATASYTVLAPPTPTISLVSGEYFAPVTISVQGATGTQLWYSLGSSGTAPTPVPGATGTYQVTGPITLPTGADALAVIAENINGSATAVSSVATASYTVLDPQATGNFFPSGSATGPLTTHISPMTLEFTNVPRTMTAQVQVSVNGLVTAVVPVQPLSTFGGYADIPLDKDNTVTATLIVNDAGGVSSTQSQTIQWTPLDLTTIGAMSVRVGDTLLMNASASGAAVITPGYPSGSPPVSLTASTQAAVAVIYPVAGIFPASASVNGQMSASTSITVVSVDLNQDVPLAVETTMSHEWQATASTDGAVSWVPGDARDATVAVTSSEGVTNLVVTPYAFSDPIKRPYIVARLGGFTGPIIATKRVDAFQFTCVPDPIQAAWPGTEVGISAIMRPWLPSATFDQPAGPWSSSVDENGDPIGVFAPISTYIPYANSSATIPRPALTETTSWSGQVVVDSTAPLMTPVAWTIQPKHRDSRPPSL